VYKDFEHSYSSYTNRIFFIYGRSLPVWQVQDYFMTLSGLANRRYYIRFIFYSTFGANSVTIGFLGQVKRRVAKPSESVLSKYILAFISSGYMPVAVYQVNRGLTMTRQKSNQISFFIVFNIQHHIVKMFKKARSYRESLFRIADTDAR
jgi:hypothetical protein